MSGSDSDRSPNKPKEPLEYTTIREIIDKMATQKTLEAVNVYGVLTYQQMPKQSTYKAVNHQIATIVDETCGPHEKLKMNIFMGFSEPTVFASCTYGDIIRFHRMRIETYNDQPKGSHSYPKSSWIRFKRRIRDTSTSAAAVAAVTDEFVFIGNRANNTIDDYDRHRVTDLRRWLDTNPQLDALFEAKLSNRNRSSITLPPAWAADLNLEEQISCNPVRFGAIAGSGFFDVVCQVCAIGLHEANMFLIVWDGSKSKQSIFHEVDFRLDKDMALYAPDLFSYVYQIFIFDEYTMQVGALRPGDYVLVKNLTVKQGSPHSANDLLMKMGYTLSGHKYGRAISKLPSPRRRDIFDTSGLSENEIENRVATIEQKAKELKVCVVSDMEFLFEYQKFLRNEQQLDSTLNELVRVNGHNQQQQQYQIHSTPQNQQQHQWPLQPSRTVLSQVNNLLEDDPNGYALNSQQQQQLQQEHSLSQKQLHRQKQEVQSPLPQKKQQQSESPRRSPHQSSPQKQPQQQVQHSPQKEQQQLESSPRRSLRHSSPQKQPHQHQQEQQQQQQQLDSPRRSPRQSSPQKQAQHSLQKVQQLESSPRRSLRHSSPQKQPHQHQKEKEQQQQMDSPRRSLRHLSPQKQPQQQQLHSPERQPNQSPSPRKQAHLSKQSQQQQQQKQKQKQNPDDIDYNILKWKLLISKTYLVPYIVPREPSNTDIFFDSLPALAEQAATLDYMRCRVLAKINNSCFPIISQLQTVYLCCKTCRYINFVPLQLASMYHERLTKVILDKAAEPIESSQANGNHRYDDEHDETDKQSVALNFSLEWLCSAQPACASTQSSSYNYLCPRCNLDDNKYDDDDGVSMDVDVDVDHQPLGPQLDYMCRFWVILSDPHGQLSPCLLEGDVAARLIRFDELGVTPFNLLESKNMVKVMKQFNSIYLFTLEKIRLHEDSRIKPPWRPIVFYKIVDFKDGLQYL